MQNVRRETSRTFRRKKREYMKDKNIRHLYRSINEFKKGYQSRINIIKDENGNFLADPKKMF
jgi:ribosomal protein L21E